jgi:hypothetical protein
MRLQRRDDRESSFEEILWENSENIARLQRIAEVSSTPAEVLSGHTCGWGINLSIPYEMRWSAMRTKRRDLKFLLAILQSLLGAFKVRAELVEMTSIFKETREFPTTSGEICHQICAMLLHTEFMKNLMALETFHHLS